MRGGLSPLVAIELSLFVLEGLDHLRGYAANDRVGCYIFRDDGVAATIAFSPMEDRFVRALADWCPPFAGYHLYYPSRRQPTPAFNVFVEALRYRD